MNLYNIKTLFIFLMTISVIVSSCKKENGADDLSTGKATVSIKMSGIGLGATENPAKRSSLGLKASSSTTVQHVTTAFGKDLFITATLTELDAMTTSSLKASTTSAGAGSIIAFNGDYTIRVYEQGNATLKQTINCVGGVSSSFDLIPGAYKFVVTGYGNPNATGADKDPLWQEINKTVVAGSNVLDIVLKHKLTEVTVKFNAGNGRTISAIGGGTIDPNFNSYIFDEITGTVNFAGTSASKVFNFPSQPTAQTWTSNPVMIAVGTTSEGKVKLDPVTINGVSGNIELPNLSFRQGVQYDLTLTLGAKPLGGILAGGSIWAPGNLQYSNGVYSFASPTGLGSNWYFNWLSPVGVGTAPTSYMQMNSYSVDRDPCKLVSPEWHTPSNAEYQNLINSVGHATEWNYKYGGNTPGATSTGVEGVFYGSNDLALMAGNPIAYLFFPSPNTGTSIHWTSVTNPGSNTSVGAVVQFGAYGKPSGFSQDNKLESRRIRCVRTANL